MKSKPDKSESNHPTKEEFIQFGKALMAVPKKEFDRLEAKHQKHKKAAKKRKIA